MIPRLQAKVVRLNRDRGRNRRQLADWIGESVGNVGEIRTNGTARWYPAGSDHRPQRLTPLSAPNARGARATGRLGRGPKPGGTAGHQSRWHAYTQ